MTVIYLLIKILSLFLRTRLITFEFKIKIYFRNSFEKPSRHSRFYQQKFLQLNHLCPINTLNFFLHQLVYSHGDLEKLYIKFSPWLDGLPKIYDEFTEYLRIMNRFYEHVDRQKICAAYLAEHTELNDVFMDYGIWQKIVKLSVSFSGAKEHKSLFCERKISLGFHGLQKMARKIFTLLILQS